MLSSSFRSQNTKSARNRSLLQTGQYQYGRARAITPGEIKMEELLPGTHIAPPEMRAELSGVCGPTEKKELGQFYRVISQPNKLSSSGLRQGEELEACLYLLYHRFTQMLLFGAVVASSDGAVVSCSRTNKTESVAGSVCFIRPYPPIYVQSGIHHLPQSRVYE